MKMYLPKTVWRRNVLMSSHYGATYMKQRNGRVAESLVLKSYFGKQPLGAYLNEDNQIFPFKGCHISKRKPEREVQRTRNTTHPMTIRLSM